MEPKGKVNSGKVCGKSPHLGGSPKWNDNMLVAMPTGYVLNGGDEISIGSRTQGE